MTTETPGIFIKKLNNGFPAYLDFDKLRRQGIDYLGKLSGNIWTDHNVHDPGITILETLCYAMLDLGYRTNFPVGDIFARPREDQSEDDNFFTPAQILGSNPLTILDYRKLLIDISEVNNAWLEPADDYDPESFCDPKQAANAGNANQEPPCINYLNGLYHVFIDPKKNEDPAIPDKDYHERVLTKVRNALLCHRNFCEDFLDIHMLCLQEIGICAEIELELQANAELIYSQIIQELDAFISPSPKFYTLQQMIGRKKNIEEIFSGRPYDIVESHGFVDTDEFELIKRKKELHLSDIYNVLLSIKGIGAVRKLAFRDCADGKQADEWKFIIDKDHIPKFSRDCSGIQFFHSGIPVIVDPARLKKGILISEGRNGKILSERGSPYLDLAIPNGVYRKDLGHYQSIQNEFPRVYGIGEGGLSEKESAERKARALQLKAYLLFFDQLFSNYLAQLKNIRTLFSFSGTAKQSYFTGNVDTVPDLQKLLFFKSGENSESSLGKEGNTLVYPVKKEDLLPFIKNGVIKKKKPHEIPPYLFRDSFECEWNINQLEQDMLRKEYPCVCFLKEPDCYFYYIPSSAGEFVLLSRAHFKSEQEARTAADTVKYMGGFKPNYKKFLVTGTHHFSFEIELNLSSYPQYLQMITEDEDLYTRRRKGFLDHLLSRFAEQFTDYALLSFNSGFPEYAIKENDMKARFLQSYKDISSNRGRAYDYSMSGCIEKNISGFERRFRALAGIDNRHDASLCNFEVAEYDKQYIITVSLGGKKMFYSTEKYDSPGEASSDAREIFKSLQSPDNYAVEQSKRDLTSRISICYGENKKAWYSQLYYFDKEANDAIPLLHRMFAQATFPEDILVSRFAYQPMLFNNENIPVRSFKDTFDDVKTAVKEMLKWDKQINNKNKWLPAGNEGNMTGKLIFDERQPHVNLFIEEDAFDIDINATIPKKPGMHSYVVLDKADHWFKFNSQNEFENHKEAQNDSYRLLLLMTSLSNYRKTEEGTPSIYIVDGEEVVAVSDFEITGDNIDAAILQVHSIVKKHTYHLYVDQKPDKWKFKYHLGYEKGEDYMFLSDTEYDGYKPAEEALNAFIESVGDLRIASDSSKISLVPQKKKKISSCSMPLDESIPVPAGVLELLDQLLEINKTIDVLKKAGSDEPFKTFIDEDPTSKQGRFVYRLVDKDNKLAFSSFDFETRAGATEELKKMNVPAKSRYNFIEICLGGDILVTREDDPKTNWYHFQVKCRNRHYQNGPLKGQELILFESTRGYLAKEEAEKAFEDLFLEAIQKGSDRNEYGNWIGIEEKRIPSHAPYDNKEPRVFILKATMDDLGGYEDAALVELVKLCKSFPIRAVSKKDKKFHERFPCYPVIPEEDQSCSCGCMEEPEKDVYFFTVANNETSAEEWQSLRFFESFEEARKQFNFFLVLLKYRGNYYIDCDPCNGRYKIMLREVLAESIEKFIDEPSAWGENGVQRLIAVANTEHAFHPRPASRLCCYDFYVACNESFLYHPCQYVTAELRDEAMYCLKDAYKSIVNWDLAALPAPGDLIIKDYFSNAVAKVIQEKGEGPTHQGPKLADLNPCERYVEIMNRILTLGLCADKDGVYLMDASYRFEPLSDEWVNPQELKHKLIWLAWYFPVIKNKPGNYCLEIRLPGLNNYLDDWNEQLYCAVDLPSGCANPCSIAWKSKCCYTNCTDAITYFQEAIKLLGRYFNYQPVFECPCGPYGIAIHDEKDIISIPAPVDPDILHDIEIIARSPQCYSNSQEVCSAIERAWRLTNPEGLHAVEHILLRPHCDPAIDTGKKECGCRLPVCDNQFKECQFPSWEDEPDDPCDARKPACFIPGRDPYSFIATVVLPAWSNRFNNTSNRQILENMLIREAPAHVLLRILWLTPRDMHVFEDHYRGWQRTLAKNNLCKTDFDVCNFIQFLFEEKLGCLKDIDPCSCKDSVDMDPMKPCETVNNSFAKVIPGFEWLNQVNELHCWETFDCVPKFKAQGLLFLKQIPVKKPKKIGQPKPKKEAPGYAADVLNTRLTRYQKQLEGIAKEVKDKKLTAYAIRIQESDYIEASDYRAFIDAVLGSMHEQGPKQLTLDQATVLVTSVTHYFLDKTIAGSGNISEIRDSNKSFSDLRRNKLDMEKIFSDWDYSFIEEYKPKTPIGKIHKLLTGKRNPS